MRKAKEIKVEYGIQIVKPWSAEMYNHNDEVAEVVKAKVTNMFAVAINIVMAKHEDIMDLEFCESASPFMKQIQRAVTCYQIGSGYTVKDILDLVNNEIANAPYYRLNEMVSDLNIKLDKGFVGF